LDIVDKAEKIMQDAHPVKRPSLDEIFAADNWAREKAIEAIGG
jgi:1-deoxy-D-xylulose 5-phosphate reductoisomerase